MKIIRKRNTKYKLNLWKQLKNLGKKSSSIIETKRKLNKSNENPIIENQKKIWFKKNQNFNGKQRKT